MDDEPTLPVPISYIGSKYLIFDIKAISWLRQNHCICGVMGGTLPQAPSQNIFLGLPQQIMPEEAQLLVERGVAYIVDDARAHEQALRNEDADRNSAYLSKLRSQGEQVTLTRQEERAEVRRRSLKKVKNKSKQNQQQQDNRTLENNNNNNNGEGTKAYPTSNLEHRGEGREEHKTAMEDDNDDEAGESLFDSSATIKPDTNHHQPIKTPFPPHTIVPSTSDLFLPQQSPPNDASRSETQSLPLLPNVRPSSYALYKHLNSKSYYMTPGLRFGCQFSVYPGDPLRYHSHFLATAREWEEEIDLADIVGGGRLGTGTKKSHLIGGLEPSKSGSGGEGGGQGQEQEEGRVRTFSIEWAAM